MQSDELQINGRKEDNSGFDPIMVFQRLGRAGQAGTSASGRAASSALARVSLRSRMPSSPHRSILVAAASSMSRGGAHT